MVRRYSVQSGNLNLIILGLTLQKRNYINELEQFKIKTFGVLVAVFNEKVKSREGEGQDIQGTIESTLNARFHELGMDNAIARSIPKHIIEHHEQAKEIGEKYNATLVIWGDITLAGIIPRLTIASFFPPDFPLPIKSTETLLKDSLSHNAIANMQDIRFPALTDEPTLLLSFIVGLNYLAESQYEKALHYFDLSLPEEPNKYIDSSAIFIVKGAAYSDTGDYDRALAEYDQAIAIAPNSALAYTQRGAAYFHKGDFEQAILDHSRAIELDSTLSSTIYYNRANSYVAIGNFEAAILDYDRAIGLNPETICKHCTYLFRGRAYKQTGHIEDAINDFTTAIHVHAENTMAFLELGSIYHRIKEDLEQAIENYSQAIALDPESVEAYVARGFAYYEKGTRQKALEDFRKANRFGIDAVTFYIVNAFAFEIKGKPELANVAYD